MEYLQQDQCEHENGINAEGGEPRSNELRKELTRINEDSEVYAKIQSDKEFKIKESNLIERNPPDKNIITPSGADGNAIIARKDLHLDLIDITHGINEQFNSPNESPIHYRHNTKSPYEDLPVSHFVTCRTNIISAAYHFIGGQGITSLPPFTIKTKTKSKSLRFELN